MFKVPLHHLHIALLASVVIALTIEPSNVGLVVIGVILTFVVVVDLLKSSKQRTKSLVLSFVLNIVVALAVSVFTVDVTTRPALFAVMLFFLLFFTVIVIVINGLHLLVKYDTS